MAGELDIDGDPGEDLTMFSHQRFGTQATDLGMAASRERTVLRELLWHPIG